MDKYEQEHVCIQREGDSIYLRFMNEQKKEEKLKYDMKVYQ